MKTYGGMEVHLNLSTTIYEYESASHFGHFIQEESGPGTLRIGGAPASPDVMERRK
jgi:hypothetical protein